MPTDIPIRLPLHSVDDVDENRTKTTPIGTKIPVPLTPFPATNCEVVTNQRAFAERRDGFSDQFQ